jgi:polysaccharide export outer membrane protein
MKLESESRLRHGRAVVHPGAAVTLLLVFLGIFCCTSPATHAGAQEYTIQPGDVLKITVWGQDDLSKEYPVDDDGFVPFPLLGRVKASGLTTKRLASSLTEALEKDYLVNPQVLVSVKEYFFNPAPRPKQD